MSIGQTLTEAREKSGLSVEEVAAATRIRRTLISNIEADDYAACGGDFYARGHLRTIATTVGIDPAPLLAEFDASRPPEPPARASEVFEAESAARPERRGPNWSAAMAVALVLVLVYGVAQVLTGSGERVETQGLPSAAGTSRAPSASESPSVPTPSSSGSAVAQAPRDKVTVALRARGTSWVRATSGSGKELFQGLVSDKTMTFSAKSLVRLVVGDAGAVTLTVNGQEIGSPGKPGQVSRVEFTRNDPAAG